jgi:signal transduction histidine kinase
MTLQYNWYVLALALNTILTGALFLYTWKLKKAAGARYFALAILCCLIWDFAHVFELSFTTLGTKILFEKITYLGAVPVANFWFLFAFTFSQKYEIKKSYNLLWIIPIIIIIVTWTNEFHNLIWPEVYLTNSSLGVVAIYKHGVLFYTSVVYSYILLLIGMVIFVKDAFDLPKIYRSQSLIIILAVCIPWCSDVLYLFGISPVKGIDPENFTYTISGALIVFGYLRLKFLTITPIAQEIISSNIEEGIIVTDINNFLVEANQSSFKLFRNEIKTGENAQHALTKLFPKLQMDLMNNEQQVSASIDCKDCWFEFKISQVKNFRGDLLGKIFIFRDITERKIAEESLRKSEEHLQELNEIKNKFFSILSHDLRTPFSGLIGFVEILKEDYNSLSNREKENFINEIDLTTKNIYGFLEDILEWSRLNMGSFNFETKLINLHNEVGEVFNLLTYNARKKGICLINELNQQDLAKGDSEMVKLLLRNLVSNAIKFSKEGDRIRIYSRTNISNMEIFVADTGIGIPTEALPKLFRLDMKYTTSGTADEKGSGIGLVLCKEILDKLNGEIKVDSELGKGSIFTFSLPLN